MRRGGPLKRTPMRRRSRRQEERARTLAAAADEVRRRANGLCEARFSVECRVRGSQAHHVLRRSQGGTDDPGNLLWVCARCHAEIHLFPTNAVRHGLLGRMGKRHT